MRSVSKHPFVDKPNRTLLALSVPVFFSLVAEPLTGLVDTSFIARLGSASLAALGVGTAALSTVFWIFNFLAIGTQTNVAQTLGRDDPDQAVRITSLALLLSGTAGLLLMIGGWFLAARIAALLGAANLVLELSVNYVRIRLFGGPAVILMLTAFGALRGMQDMRAPLWIALTVNGLNILLDALLIPGWGPFPALGVTGAASASVISQTVGAAGAVFVVARRLGLTFALPLAEARRLLRIGGDLFVRTGSLTFFLLLATRLANASSVEAGAAHQAIRQFWIFTTLGLDALAITAQSLVGYFAGSDSMVQARRVAAYTCGWGAMMGVIISIVMLIGRHFVADLFVPPTARAVFFLPWFAALLVQPINGLAFVTDGIHWGTADFAYLRNAVLLATLAGSFLLLTIDTSAQNALFWVWAATVFWIIIRALLGMLRIWPGIGRAPLAHGAGV